MKQKMLVVVCTVAVLLAVVLFFLLLKAKSDLKSCDKSSKEDLDSCNKNLKSSKADLDSCNENVKSCNENVKSCNESDEFLINMNDASKFYLRGVGSNMSKLDEYKYLIDTGLWKPEDVNGKQVGYRHLKGEKKKNADGILEETKNYLIDGNESTSANLKNCAVKCAQNQDCMSFQYNLKSNENNCLMFNNEGTEYEGGTYISDFKYFAKSPTLQ